MKNFKHILSTVILLSGCAIGEDYNPKKIPYHNGFNPELMADGGCETIIKGTVVSPARFEPDPVFNAAVYVPKNNAIPEIHDGVLCEKCQSIDSAQAIAFTDIYGHFEIKNVVPNKNFPLVVQIGKWQRAINIESISACETLTVPSIRLPRNSKEGNIPHIAIITGSVDPMECVLYRMGIDKREFTNPTEPGRIHIYQHNGNAIDKTTPSGKELYNSIDILKRYDIVLLPCEGSPIDREEFQIKNLMDYANSGGRIFATHYSYTWFQNKPFSLTANWNLSASSAFIPYEVQIDTTFIKGKAFADWLYFVGASWDYGSIVLNSIRTDVDTVNSLSQRWLYAINKDGKEEVKHFSFNTPVFQRPENKCGKVIFSDFHVVYDSLSGGTFPACVPRFLSPEEKTIEFMLFDLSACIQPDESTILY